MDVTEEMVEAFLSFGVDESEFLLADTRAGLDAVLAIAERDLRKQIADVIDDRTRLLRGDPFRSGQVGIEYINGIEDAGSYVETGEWS